MNNGYTRSLRVCLLTVMLAMAVQAAPAAPSATTTVRTETTVTTETTMVDEAGEAIPTRPRNEVKRHPDVTVSDTITVATTTEMMTGEVFEDRDDPRAVRAIRTYCAEIDRFITKSYQTRREFALAGDESTGRWIGWTEVTGDRSAHLRAGSGAVTYTRNGKYIFVECFSRNRPNRPLNLIRYYFWPDGSLAKTHTVLRTFRDAKLDDRVEVIRERFQERDGASVGQNDEYRHPKTRKRLKPLLYAADIRVGYSLFSINRVRDLPFFDLLQKPRPKS